MRAAIVLGFVLVGAANEASRALPTVRPDAENANQLAMFFWVIPFIKRPDRS
jgi:hypothetical protein